MFKNIIVPVDGSLEAEKALPIAIKLAQQAEAKLIFLHAQAAVPVPVPDSGEHGLYWPAQAFNRPREVSKDYLQNLEQQSKVQGVNCETKVVDGDPATGIVEFAEREATDLIVMSTHGYSGLTRWMLGSVTEKVLRHAPCPVLALRSNQPIKRILLTLDGSTLAEMALEPGLQLAQMLGAQVMLLRVRWPNELMDRREIADFNKVEPGLGDIALYDYEHREERYVEELVAQYRRRVDVIIEGAVFRGPVADTILTYADQENFDLVVMSTHGRTGLKRWRYGSMTEKVLRQAGKSMLIVRPPEQSLN